MANLERSLFEYSKAGRKGYAMPKADVEPADLEKEVPAGSQRAVALPLPEVYELDVVRHFVRLSQLNFAVDTGFYPLGSCTMKYNPKVNEEVANLPGFRGIHPLQPDETAQGVLHLMYDLEKFLCEIFGMDAFSLQPAAGAQGEFSGIAIIKAYLQKKGLTHKTRMLIPDSAHGTNPASAHMAGFEVVEIPTCEKGLVSAKAVKAVANDETAGLMLTNPSTLGLFEEEILEVARAVHRVGGLLYYDGANANAILGKARPGDMGFDVIHTNLHKTFSTPHGGGGPGSGPVGVKKALAPFLPVPRVVKKRRKYFLDYEYPDSIGRVKVFHGNVGMHVRAYTYIRENGPDGLKAVAEDSVLSANYLRKRLAPLFAVPFDRTCMHEFVVSAQNLKDKYGVRALDVVKRLLDFGVHAPTVYFPLIVHEAMMIEPTETESIENLKHFAEAMETIVSEAASDPEKVKSAPHTTPVQRPDEARAARQPDLAWRP